ncbi:MAG TPA: hypothetical protein VIJ53_08830 [Acidobacteriaceae bacterium]
MTPDIAEIERVPAGALITFEDGRSAIYSTLLLYELLPNAQLVDDLKSEEVSTP